MHISEGVVSFPILLSGGILAAVGTVVGLKRLDYEHIMTTSLIASAFFVASLVHVPLGPGSIHLVLNGLLGLILGWASVPAIAVALLLQALLFGYGGLTVLGVNTVIMAGPALVVYFLFGKWIGSPGKKRLIGAFLAGALAIGLSAIILAGALIGADEAFFATAKIVALAHLPIMIIEGCMTMFTVSFLLRVQPSLFSAVKIDTP